MFLIPHFTFLKQFFPSQDISKTSRSLNDLFRHEFVQNLLKNNRLTIRLLSGEFYQVEALSYDRPSHQLVISDRAENGFVYLEKGEKVEFYTSVNEDFDYFSFYSRVEKIKTLGNKLIYYMSVPEHMTKKQRRVFYRYPIKHHSIVRIEGTNFSGHVHNLSLNGIGFILNGYYPFPLEIGYDLEGCQIDILQPRINDNIELTCSINVRRIAYVGQPERQTIIGGVINRSTIEQEEQINKFISLQQSS